MSNLYDAHWTTSEKVVLLTNIIQGAGKDVPAFLIQTIQDHNIHPRWDDMALPAGRSVGACRMMYSDLLHGRGATRSFSSVHPLGYPAPGFPSPIVPVRALSEHEVPPPAHRSIQPRPPRSSDSPLPPTSNGDAFTILRPFAPEPGALAFEKRRKRGRPTLEEIEERKRRLAATGQTYEPRKRPAKKPRPSETTFEPRPKPSPEVSQTPLPPHVAPDDENSSAKRRSRRLRDEESASQPPPGTYPWHEAAYDDRDHVAHSPSDRLLLRSNERAPAISAVARDITLLDRPDSGRQGEVDPRQDPLLGPALR